MINIYTNSWYEFATIHNYANKYLLVMVDIRYKEAFLTKRETGSQEVSRGHCP